MYRSIIQILREHTCFQHLNGTIFSKHFTLRNASKRTLAIFSSPVLLLCVHTRYNPFAHPSCSYYYFLSPSILFLHILFVFAHLIVLHFLFYCTFYSYFSFFTIYMLLCCYFYIIFILLHCPLSGPDLIYISLLIIPCIIYYVTNKETLNLDTNT